MEEFQTLSKKERKQIKKEEYQRQLDKTVRMQRLRKWGIIGIIVLALAGLGWWSTKELSKPLPGSLVADLGREHVADGTVVEYNSNPPTSGSHYEEWTRAGIYTQPISDGHLIHSLEHGYVIVSYNCQKFQISNFKFPISNVYAHEEELSSSPSALRSEPSGSKTGASPSGELSKEWESKECNELKNNLKGITEEERLWKLIVIPRPQLDTAIAVTAWTRIEKMNAFDKERIIRFIDAYRDRGPEKTHE